MHVLLVLHRLGHDVPADGTDGVDGNCRCQTGTGMTPLAIALDPTPIAIPRDHAEGLRVVERPELAFAMQKRLVQEPRGQLVRVEAHLQDEPLRRAHRHRCCRVPRAHRRMDCNPGRFFQWDPPIEARVVDEGRVLDALHVGLRERDVERQARSGGHGQASRGPGSLQGHDPK
jgi:hypothetical protein